MHHHAVWEKCLDHLIEVFFEVRGAAGPQAGWHVKNDITGALMPQLEFERTVLLLEKITFLNMSKVLFDCWKNSLSYSAIKSFGSTLSSALISTSTG